MDLISIIVPIYNIEKYLRECVDSLVNQTYKNIEILLIDDGSTDSSGKIADELANKDDRIKVFHKKNGGLSDARNYGIEKASGKYLSFIDSDDYVSTDFIEFLYNNLIKNNVKISSCAFVHFFDDGVKKNVLFRNIEKKYDVYEAQIYLNTIGYFNASSCNKLFDATLFDDIKFPVNVTSEDLFIMYKLIHKANGLYYNSEEKYFYRQRRGSITKNVKINYNVIDAALEQLDFYKEKKLETVIPYGYQTLFFSYLGVYNTLLCRGEKSKCKEIYIKLLEIKKFITKNNISKSRKIQIWLFYFNIHIYNFVFLLFDKIRKK